jgi:hypothetical protein
MPDRRDHYILFPVGRGKRSLCGVKVCVLGQGPGVIFKIFDTHKQAMAVLNRFPKELVRITDQFTGGANGRE